MLVMSSSSISHQLAELANEVMQTRRVSPSIEERLDSLLWNREFDRDEMAHLKRLEEALAQCSA